jgi:GT2 family glycosyltransferase
VAPHAILHRKGAESVDFIDVLRSYELRFVESGSDVLSRVCPHFDQDAFRKVVESLGPSDVRAPSLARYLASSPALRHRSFVDDVDDDFFAAQYPGLVDYCEKARGLADVNRIAARWVKPLDLPTQIGHAIAPAAGMLGLHELGALRSFRSKLEARPRVSFLIPSYGRDDLVLRCVLSAIQSPGASAIEFFVAEDADHIDCGWILGYFTPFVTMRRNATNLGFLRSCNAAVQETRGEIVLLVNNDVIVHRDAVNELLEAFDAFPRAGVMGGLILNRDGTIQENGGMLWRDASAWNYRRNRALDAESLFNTREVDYVSGCWFGVRRAIWDEVGGFDDRFAPAYCEESDLCMTVRHRGYEVRVAPHSVVTHLDGATMGQDENGNTLKAYQRINREKLVHKWRHVLARHNENGAVSPFHTGFDDGNRSIVVVFDHYVPEYDRDAGSRTIFAMLRALAAVRDNYVVFVPMNNARGKYARALERMGIEVISGGEGWTRFDELLTKHPARIKHALVSRIGVAAHFVWHLDQIKCPKSIYLHDIEALRAFPTGAESALGEALISSAMDRYAERHRGVLGKFDHVLSCSQEETAVLKAFVTRSVVDVFPYNHPASVACDDVSSRRDILFVGSYNHPPNREAIEYFLETAWPEVRARLPSSLLHICGSGFENATFAADPRVIVHGHVTDATLAYLYASSRVAIAPLISGAGIKGKVIEACAHGVFPLGSAAAWQGIDVPAGYEFLAGSMESFGARLVTAFEAFDFRAREAMIAFYEGLRRTNNIDDVLPALVSRGRRSR